MQVRRELRPRLHVLRRHAGRGAADEGAVGREIDVGLVLARWLGRLPLLGVGVTTRRDETSGFAFERVVQASAVLVAAAFHGTVPTAGRRWLTGGVREIRAKGVRWFWRSSPLGLSPYTRPLPDDG